jgi:adenylate cyclase
MKFFAQSLTFKLVGYFSALSLLTVSAVGAIALLESRQTLKRSIFERLETTANLQEQTIAIWFGNQTDHYEALSQNSQFRMFVQTLLAPTVTDEVRKEAQRNLFLLAQQEIATTPGVKELLVLDERDGSVIFSTQAQHVGQNYRQTVSFVEGRRESSVRYPQQGDGDFVFSQPIKGAYQEFIGVLMVRLDASELARVVLQFHDPERFKFNYLATADGYLLTADAALLRAWESSDNGAIQQVIAGHSGEDDYVNLLGQDVFGLYRWLPEQKLALFVELDRSQALQPLRVLVWKVIAFGTGVAGLAIAGSYVIARLITKPILAIKDTATEVTQGNLKIKAPKFTEDEVGTLADTFNQMIEEFSLLYDEFHEQVTQLEMAEISAQHSYHELQEEKRKVERVMEQLGQANEEISLLNDRLKTENLDLAAEIQATNERLNQFLEAIPVGILVFDGSGNMVYFNRKAQLLLTGDDHATIDEIAAYPLYLTETQALCVTDMRLGQRALRQKTSNTYDDVEVHRDQQHIPLEAWETPILDDHGTVKYAIVAFQDITERRQAEREKQDYTHKLWQLNQANERFVPRQFLQLLDKHSIVDVQLGDNIQKEMTVLFADIRGFTGLSEKMSPEDNFKFINAFLSRMNPAISCNYGFIDKYIGDAIMALFSRATHADDSLQSAIAMLQTLDDYNKTRQRPGREPIRIGLGLNSGLMRCGTVGGEQHMESTVISDAVNLASRLERLTKIYRTSLLISHHTFLRLEEHDRYHIRLIDNVTVTGKSVAVSVYEVFDVDDPAIAAAKKESRATFEQGFVLYRLRQFVKAQRLFQQCVEYCPDDYVSQLYVERCQQNMLTSVPKPLSSESVLEDGRL